MAASLDGSTLGDAVVAAIDLPLIVLGADRTVISANPAAEALLGFDPGELEGARLDDFLDVDYVGDVESRWAMATELGGTAGRNGHFRARDGSPMQLPFALHPEVAPGRHLLVIGDIPHRSLRRVEEDLRTQLLDQVEAAIVVVDAERRIVVWNAGAERLYGWPRAAAIGKTGEELGMVVDDEALGEADLARGRLEAGGSSRVQVQVRRRDGRLVPIEAHGSAIRRPDGAVEQYAYVVIDVSGREEREDQLRRRAEMHEAVAELASVALAGESPDELMRVICKRVAELLDAPFVKVLELVADEPDLVLRAGVGWSEALHVPASDSHVGFALASGEAVVLEDLELEWRFHASKPLRERGVKSGIAVTIPGRDEPFGVIAAHHPDAGHFDAHQAAFLESVANVLGAAISRHRSVA
jgi:PAS domain S-box-containing protein